MKQGRRNETGTRLDNNSSRPCFTPSNYAQASGEALRGGASVLSVTWDVYLNLETAGLKGLGDSAKDWYQTGDATRFQEHSGGFLAGALTAKAGEVVAESGIGERAPKRGTAAPQADSPQGGKPVTPGGETPVPDSPVPSSPEGGPAPNAVNPRDAAALIADSNKKFPLTQTNAEAALKPPPGASSTEVAGPGGAGPDITFRAPDGSVIMQREVKSIAGNYNSFNQQLSNAAKGQLQGAGEVFVQVSQGTDVTAWLQRFRSAPGRNLADYAGVSLQVVDDGGTVLYSGPIQ
jgi:hypothetical protein